MIITLLAFAYLKRKTAIFYVAFRISETLTPLGNNVLLIPALSILLIPFRCYRGESSERLNFEYDCNYECYSKTHTLIIVLSSIIIVIYGIVSIGS